MKTNIFTVALLAMAVATSCSKDLDSVTSGTEDNSSKDEPVTISVGVTTGSTRATSAGAEEKIQSLQVFLFDSYGLEESVYFHDSKATLQCGGGDKTVAVCANYKEIPTAGISSPDDLSRIITDLSENTADSFIMYGTLPVSVKHSEVVTVPVTRLVAKVVLRSLKNEMREAVLDGTVHIKDIFVNNVMGESPLVPYSTFSTDTWYNLVSLDTENPLEILFESNLQIDIERGKTYNTQHYFYCYPNPTATDYRYGFSVPRYTRLVIHAEVNDYLGYYSVDIPQVKANTSYLIDLTVTDMPHLDPERMAGVMNDAVFVSVVEWDESVIEGEE